MVRLQQLLLLLLLVFGGSCIVDDLSAVGRPCPCEPETGTVCDKAIGRCVPAGDGGVLDGGRTDGGRADGGGADGPSADKSPGVDATADQGSAE